MAKLLQNKFVFDPDVGEIVLAYRLPVTTVCLGNVQEINHNNLVALACTIPFRCNGRSRDIHLPANGKSETLLFTDIVNMQVWRDGAYELYTQTGVTLEGFKPLTITSLDCYLFNDLLPILGICDADPVYKVIPEQFHVPVIRVTKEMLEGETVATFAVDSPFFPYAIREGDYIVVTDAKNYRGDIVRSEDFRIRYMLE